MAESQTTKTSTPQSQLIISHINSDTDSESRSGTAGSKLKRKHTPYTKTPRTRRLTARQTQLTRTPVEQDLSGLKELQNRTWRSYKVSPLYQFSHKPDDLRKYSKLLGAFLEAESSKGTGVETERADKASFTIIKGVRHSEDDPDAVKITVKGKAQTGSGAGITTMAVLFSVDIEPGHKAKLKYMFTHLPVLLLSGPGGIQSMISAWLQRQFDCHISYMTHSAHDLSWMVAMWAGSGTEERGAKKVELVYSVPKECEGLTSITLTIDPTDCKVLWDSIHDPQADTFTGEEVSAFIKSLESHFYHHFKVKLSAMQLSRIGTSIVYVGTEGKIKIFSKDHIHKILRHMTELATNHQANSLGQ